jgi:hypothetical protein
MAAQLITPAPGGTKIKSITDFLSASAAWQDKQASAGGGRHFLSQLWYRGVKRHFTTQLPGVYRTKFSERAKDPKLTKSVDLEDKRLHLEREMLAQFRVAGAAFLDRSSLADIYFTAQHFGMPTRLLDWSTNPLSALFFASDGAPGEDGVVYAMDARRIIPPDVNWSPGKKLYQAIVTMRHPFVEYAVGLSFWDDVKPGYGAYVLPVRPDVVPGRIGQQSSCFTLHMHKADDAQNDTLVTLLIDGGSKEKILDELHRLNINQFTTYFDLDHLSKEIRRAWNVVDN